MLYLCTRFLWAAPIQLSTMGIYSQSYSIISLLVAILRILLKAYPFVFFIYVVNSILTHSVPKLHVPIVHFSTNFQIITGRIALITLLLLTLFNFVYISIFFTDRIPHTSADAIGYSAQAKIFAQNKLYFPEPQFSEHFPITSLLRYQNKWFSWYPFGYPLILSIGYRIGMPWIIPPILGTLSVFFIFLLGRELYSQRVGFWSALILYSSPFFQMNSVDFMSHSASLLFALISTWLFIKTLKTGNRYLSLLCGISFGFLLNIRPYTTVFIALPFVAYILYLLVKNWKQTIHKNFRLFFPMFMGALFMTLQYFLYNYMLLGDPFMSPYSFGNGGSFGFFDTRTVNNALQDVLAQLSVFDRVVLGWPLGLSFFFLIVYVLTPMIKKWELLFAAVILSLVGGYFFYRGSWMTYGPRYWYEIIPYFILLTVCGIEKLPQLLGRPHQREHVRRKWRKNIILSAYVVSITLVCFNLWNWLSAQKPSQKSQDFAPINIGEMKNFNGAQRILIDTVEEMKLRNSLIFVAPSLNWQSYGIPSYFMDISLQGDIVYAQDLGDEKNKRLLGVYPHRSYFKADYESGEVVSYPFDTF